MQKALRVGIVIYGEIDQVSGGYLYDRMMSLHLAGHGCVVEILSLPKKSYISSFVAPGMKRVLADIRDRGPFDAIIIDELCHPSFAFRLKKTLRTTGCRTILLVHHLLCTEDVGFLLKAISRILERNVVRHVDGFIFNSTSTEREVKRLRLPDDTRTHVIAHPAGNRFAQGCRPGVQSGRKVLDGQSGLDILFVGNIIPRKGLHVLIRALDMLCSQRGPGLKVRLTVAGSDAFARRYANRMKRRAIKSSFSTRFVGHTSDEELSSLYSTHHLLCVPSSFEGFGIIYLEGMYFGLPALGTTQGGASDIISHGKNGFLVEPGDPAAIARILSSLIDEPRMYRSLSLEALRTADNAPTWESSMSKIYEFVRYQ